MTTTKIQWTDSTWNPVRGCSRVSKGCDACYAMGQAHRFSGPGKPYEGLTTLRNGKVDWTGVARFVPEMLSAPLKWKKPRRIFVNSMSDLFHRSVTNEQIAAVFGVMAACPQHTFQILTKRPERMLEWFKWVGGNRGYEQAGQLHVSLCEALRGPVDWDPDDRHCEALLDNANDWPLPNVWLGVSAEDQQRADERVPLLLQCPAAVRFVSAEPLLGPINMPGLKGSTTIHVSLNVEGAIRNRSFHGFVDESGKELAPADAEYELRRASLLGIKLVNSDGCHNFDPDSGCRGHRNSRLDWVIVGGESGPGARPCELGWIHSLVQQCQKTNVACFVKQIGSHAVAGGLIDMETKEPYRLRLKDRKGGDMSEWAAPLRVREFPA